MGWMGSVQQAIYALETVKADKDDDGKFRIYQAAPCIGLDGDEMVLPDESLYSINGIRLSWAGLMNTTSYGLRNIKVIC